MTDDAFASAEAWLRHFQALSFDVQALVDPARAAARVGEAMRGLGAALPFDRAPGRLTEVLESLASPPPPGPAQAAQAAPDAVPEAAAPDGRGVTARDDLALMPLARVATALRAGDVSAVEVTRACLDRIRRFGEDLHCIAAIDHDAAIEQARAADARRARGDVPGPLLGVPLAHKDMFYRRGRESACGSSIRAGFIPDVTAAALERLDAAGALDIARLHMVEFALGVTGHNAVTDTPRNPWNTEHMTGGSSSGSGAAVAAGLVYGALGSDTGGSIRFPASCCGLVGLKPTLGRVSRFGAMPLASSLDTIGPLTRTVVDNALIFRAIAGPDARDPGASRLAVPDPLAAIEDGIRGLRLGVPENYFLDGADAEIAAAVAAATDVFETLGACLVPVRAAPEIAVTNGMTSLITATEGAALHARWMRRLPDDYGRQTLGRLVAGAMTPAIAYLDAIQLREPILRRFLAETMADADVVITPVMMTPVPTIAESDLAANPGFSAAIIAMGHATRPVNYMGLPGLSVPCGFTRNGLPTAFQLVGRPFDEATLYRCARAYERETGSTAPRPAL